MKNHEEINAERDDSVVTMHDWNDGGITRNGTPLSLQSVGVRYHRKTYSYVIQSGSRVAPQIQIIAVL